MDFCYQYIDELPSIPENFLSDVESFNQFDLQDTSYVEGRSILYRRWSVNPKFENWIKANICDQYAVLSLQTHHKIDEVTQHSPHTDRTRPWVLLYLIESGGDMVTTSWYRERNEPLLRDNGLHKGLFKNQIDLVESTQVETKRWCLLNSRIIHGVTGITGTRMSFAISITRENPFEVLKIN
jgi:hypothetical protein